MTAPPTHFQRRHFGLSALALAAVLAATVLSQGQSAPTSPAAPVSSVPYVTQALPEIAQLPAPSNSPKSTEDLKAIQARVESVVKHVLPAVVALRINVGQGEREEGSGVIVSRDGYVLTAGHVSGAPRTAINVILSNGAQVSGLAMGANTQIDSGMVKITTPADYPFVPIGSSSSLALGQWVIAMGHPGGYQADRPPVVRIGRVIKWGSDRSRGSTPYIQTDCELIMGDSGGPVFDLDGRLVGINSRIGLQQDSNVHVPIDTYTDTWERLAKGEQWRGGVSIPFLNNVGSSVRNPISSPAPSQVASIGSKVPDEVPNGLKLPSVVAGRAAENAGLQEGDIITRIDGQIVRTVVQLTEFLVRHKPGDVVTVDFLRDDKLTHAKLTLDAMPVSASSGRVTQRVKAEDTKSSQTLESAFSLKSDGGRSPVNANKSTVRIFVSDRDGNPRPVALGTIVSNDGYILTKRSEVVAWPKILVNIDGQRNLREARIIGRSEPLDLVLLKIEARNLTPVVFADTRPPAQIETNAAPPGNFFGGRGRGGRNRGNGPVSVPKVIDPAAPPEGAVPVVVGQWVATPDAGASMGKDLPPKYVGVISATRRPIPGPDRERLAAYFDLPVITFLGIGYGTGPEPANPKGVEVMEAVADSGAAAAGVRAGDMITAIDGMPMRRRADVTSVLSSCQVGDPLAVTVLRGAESLTLRIVLGPRPELPQDDPDFQLLSGHVSKRSREFPAVFQHDTLLEPADCGGPLLDLEGRVIGINIARAGRTEAYALPADIVVPAIEALKVNRLAK